MSEANNRSQLALIGSTLVGSLRRERPNTEQAREKTPLTQLILIEMSSWNAVLHIAMKTVCF